MLKSSLSQEEVTDDGESGEEYEEVEEEEVEETGAAVADPDAAPKRGKVGKPQKVTAVMIEVREGSRVCGVRNV